MRTETKLFIASISSVLIYQYLGEVIFGAALIGFGAITSIRYYIQKQKGY